MKNMNEVLVYPALLQNAEEAAKILAQNPGQRRVPVPSYNGFYVIRAEDERKANENFIHTFDFSGTMFTIVAL